MSFYSSYKHIDVLSEFVDISVLVNTPTFGVSSTLAEVKYEVTV